MKYIYLYLQNLKATYEMKSRLELGALGGNLFYLSYI